MSNQYYLVGGTMRELRRIARERDIDPKLIRLIRSVVDMYGCRGGKIILGDTSRYEHPMEYDEIIAYALTHNIEVP